MKTLADERLLVTSQVAGSAEETIEVSHEALIRHWERLKEWVEADRRFLAWQQRLSAAMEEWEGNKRNADLLLRGIPLTESVGLAEEKARLSSRPGNVSLSGSARIGHRGTSLPLPQSLRPGAHADWWAICLVVEGGSDGQIMPYPLSSRSAGSVSALEPEMVEIPGGDFLQGDVITQAQ